MKLNRLKVALPLAIAALAVSGVAVAEDFTPDQLKDSANNGESGPATAQGTSVTPAQAAAAGEAWAGLPGTDSEGTPPASGPDAPQHACWQSLDQMWHQWGFWPNYQKVYENRYWCANQVGGYQTYRTSHVYLATYTCNHSNPYGTRVSGGNGYTWTTVRSGGHFSCPSGIPWLTYQFDDWQEWACNVWGNCSYVRSGRL